MLNHLKGIVTTCKKNTPNKFTLILEVNHIGYEIFIPARLASNLPTESETIVCIYTHQQIREEQIILYGFESSPERDLFRLLINVSGIGANTAIALLDTLEIIDLIQAIVQSNTKLLSKTPGVGIKTAERLTVELKTKLTQWRKEIELTSSSSTQLINPQILDELEITLIALGYTNNEIRSAIEVITKDPLLQPNPNPEDWIRSAITWLSSNT